MPVVYAGHVRAVQGSVASGCALVVIALYMLTA